MKYVKTHPSKALDDFVRKQCNSLAQRLESHPNKYKISMALKVNSRNADGIATSYEISGSLKVAGQASLRAKKIGKDPKKAVSSVIDALSKQIRRSTEKKERSRKTLGRSLKPVRHLTWELEAN